MVSFSVPQGQNAHAGSRSSTTRFCARRVWALFPIVFVLGRREAVSRLATPDCLVVGAELRTGMVPESVTSLPQQFSSELVSTVICYSDPSQHKARLLARQRASGF